jgi:cell division septation protein DedD
MMRRRPLARMAVRTTVVAGTAAAVGAHVANKNAAAAQEAQAAPVAEAPAPAPAPAAAAPAEPDKIAQLTQLAALRDSGALTEAEFAAEKAKILA